MREVRIGGLMRCCLETLSQYQKAEGVEEIGQVLHCKWCKDGEMIVAPDGVWEWLKTKGVRE